jgi:hypothetical protein
MSSDMSSPTRVIPPLTDACAALQGVERHEDLVPFLRSLADRFGLIGVGALVRGPFNSVYRVAVGVPEDLVETVAAEVVPLFGHSISLAVSDLRREMRAPFEQRGVVACVAALAAYPGGSDGRLVALMPAGVEATAELRTTFEVFGLALALTLDRLNPLEEARVAKRGLIELIAGAALLTNRQGVVEMRNSRARHHGIADGQRITDAWTDPALAAAVKQRREWKGFHGNLQLTVEPLPEDGLAGFVVRLLQL